MKPLWAGRAPAADLEDVPEMPTVSVTGRRVVTGALTGEGTLTIGDPSVPWTSVEVLLANGDAVTLADGDVVTLPDGDVVTVVDGDVVTVVDETRGDPFGEDLEKAFTRRPRNQQPSRLVQEPPVPVVSARAERLLRGALGWLPPHEQERCTEEWTADLLELAGDNRAQLKHALGLLWSALSLRRVSKRPSAAAGS